MRRTTDSRLDTLAVAFLFCHRDGAIAAGSFRLVFVSTTGVSAASGPRFLKPLQRGTIFALPQQNHLAY